MNDVSRIAPELMIGAAVRFGDTGAGDSVLGASVIGTLGTGDGIVLGGIVLGGIVLGGIVLGGIVLGGIVLGGIVLGGIVETTGVGTMDGGNVIPDPLPDPFVLFDWGTLPSIDTIASKQDR
jgi:hypothetical protein